MIFQLAKLNKNFQDEIKRLCGKSVFYQNKEQTQHSNFILTAAHNGEKIK